MNEKAQAISLQPKAVIQKTVYSILFTISFTHLLNDMMQSVIPAIYPLLKTNFNFSFTQIGMINFTFQLTASLLQPFIGYYTDGKPRPFSLAVGMAFTLLGLILLSVATGFYTILIAVSLIGLGSSVFHPESSRVAHLASGGKKGLAQSIFQLGGNAGGAIGPLLTALIVVPYGRFYIMWFAMAAILAILILIQVGKWYQGHLTAPKLAKSTELEGIKVESGLSRKRILIALTILMILIFSKYFYMASMTSYFTFYLIEKFQVSVQQSQLYLFVFLASVAIGTVIGGPLGDRFGRKYVIWFSILGAAPFTLLLPYMDLTWTIILSIVIGVVISSAFSAILVYATDLVPNKVGMIAGLFFGFAFGMGGVGSAILGWLADKTSIEYIFKICAYLPLIGIITWFLPNVKHKKE